MLKTIPIPGNWQPALPGKYAYHGAHVAIQLVNAGNFQVQIGTIGRREGWRADRQPSPSGFTNIHIQKDGVRGTPSSAACVLVPNVLGDQIVGTGEGPIESRPRFKELTNAINKALNLSLSSRREARGQWQIQMLRSEGTFSS